MEQTIKFLIIRFSSIGDIVLTTPIVRMLKKQVSGAEIHFVTKKQYASIVEPNPHVEKVHVLDRDFDALIKELKHCHFDYIIDLHNNLRSLRVKNKLGLPAFTFDKLNWEKWLLVNFKKNKMPNVHIVDRYLATTAVFDLKNDEAGLDYFIPENDEVNPQDLGVEPNEYIALVIGATYFTKRLTTGKLIEIANNCTRIVVLIGGQSDEEIAKKIAAETGDNVINSVGKYNLHQSASLVKQAYKVVSHDTGLMHVAAAFGKRIASIWGNTVPEFGMYPYLSDEESKQFEVRDLKCRPCTKLGFSRCPKKHFDCMEKIDIEGIVKFCNS